MPIKPPVKWQAGYRPGLTANNAQSIDPAAGPTIAQKQTLTALGVDYTSIATREEAREAIYQARRERDKLAYRLELLRGLYRKATCKTTP